MTTAPPTVATGQTISSSLWGNVVRDAILDLDDRLDDMDALNIGSRLTATESVANTANSDAKPVRSWRYVEFQPCGFGPHLITLPTVVWGDTNISYSGGSFTVGESGIYQVVASVTGSSGIVTSVEWRSNGATLVSSVLDSPMMWGAGAGDVFTFYAYGSNSGVVITGGHIQIVRLSAP